MLPLTKFYIFWALSSWGDRLWSFALSMYFITINENSLLITAIDGLCVNLVLILLGAYIGKLIDKHSRLNTVRFALLIQNSTIGLVCIIFVLLFSFNKYARTAWNGSFYYAVQALAICLNVVSNLASTAQKISIEKDWVIVIAQSESDLNSENSSPQSESDKNRLANINSILRGINLSTIIIAPVIAGALMSVLNRSLTMTDHYYGTMISAICFTVWNFVSYLAESRILTSLYNQVPLLQKIKQTPKSVTNAKKRNNIISETLSAWKTYFRQGLLVLPGIALSLLYLTVLGFDSITLGYAKSQNLSEASIAIISAFGSVSGILGTLAFSLLYNRAKLFLPFIILTGSIFQTTTLLFSVISIFLPGSSFSLAVNLLGNDFLHGTNSTKCFKNITSSELEMFLVNPKSPCHNYTSIIVLLVSMSISRFGLWLTDLATNQTIQENIDESERGTVAGVQASLNQTMDLIKFFLVISLPNVIYFGYLVIISTSALFISFLLYTVYAIRAKITEPEVPISEIGPFRKSMITVVTRHQTKDNNNDDISHDSSFDE